MASEKDMIADQCGVDAEWLVWNGRTWTIDGMDWQDWDAAMGGGS